MNLSGNNPKQALIFGWSGNLFSNLKKKVFKMPTPNNLYIQLTLILYEPVSENEMLVMKNLRANKGLNSPTRAGHCDPPHI